MDSLGVSVTVSAVRKLLIATRNAHKVGEIRAILGDGFECFSLDQFKSAPEVIEDVGTFAGNATKKAVELAKWAAKQAVFLAELTSQPEDLSVLADDSGLEVDALGGAPGVHSARFAALDTGHSGNSSSAQNNTKLLRLLKLVPREKRTARFRCVLALVPVLSRHSLASPVCFADEFEMQTQIFQGICEGSIGFELQGAGGFGYDPLFFPLGFNRTFGELSEGEKNTLSHRAKALAAMRTTLVGSEAINH